MLAELEVARMGVLLLVEARGKWALVEGKGVQMAGEQI